MSVQYHDDVEETGYLWVEEGALRILLTGQEHVSTCALETELISGVGCCGVGGVSRAKVIRPGY